MTRLLDVLVGSLILISAAPVLLVIAFLSDAIHLAPLSMVLHGWERTARNFTCFGFAPWIKASLLISAWRRG